MTDKFQIGHLYPGKIPPGIHRKPNQPSQVEAGHKSFHEVLNERLIQFSHHAEMRLQQRGIQLGSEQMNKIQHAVDKAAAKGAKESLVLLEDLALIVNIKNRTVITAMDGASMKDNVFTQIDSAVII